MMTRSSLRSRYGNSYCTVIDDQVITWKPLSIQEFFYYDDLSRDPELLPSVLEDEIFRKCVDKEYAKEIDKLSAGTISVVVQNIMEHSGPLSVDHFNAFLDEKRIQAKEPINHLVTLVIRAFPGYTPEQVYALPFDTFMLRIAQAESLLMLLNIVTEPIRLTNDAQEEQEPQPKQRKVPNELKAIFDQQQKKIDEAKQKAESKAKHGNKTINPLFEKARFDKIDMSFEQSPVLKKDIKHPLHKPVSDLDVDRVAQERAVGSEEKSEERATMVKDAQHLYKALMDKLPYYTKK